MVVDLEVCRLLFCQNLLVESNVLLEHWELLNEKYCTDYGKYCGPHSFPHIEDKTIGAHYVSIYNIQHQRSMLQITVVLLD